MARPKSKLPLKERINLTLSPEAKSKLPKILKKEYLSSISAFLEKVILQYRL